MRMSAHIALSISAAPALLTACGGLQPPIGASGAMPQSRAIATYADRAGSWMLPSSKRRDLLYLSSGQRVSVYSYPHGGLVGILTGFSEARGECVDKAGDVFITDNGTFATYEYAHGGTSPIATLNSAYSFPSSCSIDPTTGRLAVVSLEGVTIFVHNKRGWRYPKPYRDSIYFNGYGGYDDSGDLFIDGTSAPPSSVFQFQELPKGSSTFVNVTLNQAIKSPGEIQWDGHYLAVGDSGRKPFVIYQFSISGSDGNVQGSTVLRGTSNDVGQFWIQRERILAPDYVKDGKSFTGIFKYPAGGAPTKTIAAEGTGTVVSPAK
jgi:hypothetical protein